MLTLLFQVAATADGGFRVDPAWIVTILLGLLSTLTGTIAILYRGQIAALRERIVWLEEEGKRKDERTDRLIQQVGRVADATDRHVSLREREGGARR